MNLRQSRREEPDISLTSLIDVVFLLLIFFMVTTSFNRESEISVNLPEASVESNREDDNTVVSLTIDVQGRYYVNDKMVINSKPAMLKKALMMARDESKQGISLLISADGKAAHQSVVTALDVAQQLGITRVSMATVHTDKDR